MNKLDLLFVVDITASMSGFINEAQKGMRKILEDLVKEYQLDLRVGLSLYRDHASQGDPFVTLVFDLNTVDETLRIIDKIKVDGGGDTPEAVICGIIDGIEGMKWREGSLRRVFLIGDAPAHGMVHKEPCCQCGRTWGDAVSKVGAVDAVLYSILLSEDKNAQDNFQILAIFSGGALIQTDDAIKAIFDTLKIELEDCLILREL